MDTEYKQTICLNMIVKNESHIIESTLKSLCEKIKFDYYVICDTGSTDNTKEIIKNFFDMKNIQGELYDDDWIDFGYNRTKAINYAFEKSDYLLIFDADDEICGDFKLPSMLDNDGYFLNFGNNNGISYKRILLVNNKIRWRFLGVLHEYIDCLISNPKIGNIEGNYYTVSGRSGNRNQNPHKYWNDALILEKAHTEALKNNDKLYLRYAFYCANSFFDCKQYEKAIEWYKITLKQDNWDQEKYVSCNRLYDCYCEINQKELALYYLVESFKYDKTRVECLYNLITHYLWNNMPDVAYGYYTNCKKYIENEYLNDMNNNNNKLFVNIDKIELMVPFYMILIADKVQKFKTVSKMYEIILKKKYKLFTGNWIGNILYNLQFFIKHCINDIPNFIQLLNEYFIFLKSNNYNYSKLQFLTFLKDYGVNIDYDEIEGKPRYSTEECKESNIILFYTGYSDILWNYSYSNKNALGGSETAVSQLSKYLPKNYKIFIAGDVEEEQFDNIIYIHNSKLSELIKKTAFHTIIISRYVSFLEIYKYFSAYQIYIWAHDTNLLPYGCDLTDTEIINKYENKIDGCICLTEWHKNDYIQKYPQLKDKIHIINNGIRNELFTYNLKKKYNKFIYSSRSERGLQIILNLWPLILEYVPDAELVISSYIDFPKNEDDEEMKRIIDSFDNIKHIGKLSQSELYKEMSTAEYWLFPSIYPETSCITALEMLMSEVICIYYPYAGLSDTIGENGIQIKPGNELQNLFGITIANKIKLKKNGRKYAESCSWEKRAEIWNNLLFEKNTNEIIEINSMRNEINELNNVTNETNKPNEINDINELNNVTNETNKPNETNDINEINELNNIKNETNDSINNNYNCEKWVFYSKPETLIYYVIDDYIKSLQTIHKIEYTEDINDLIIKNPSKITFVNEVTDIVSDNFFKYYLQVKEISYLNLEPLNLKFRLINLLKSINLLIKNNINFTIYDYSLSNIKILNDMNIHNTKHLPYVITDNETNYLKNLNFENINKIYDFGIITGCGANSDSIDDLLPKRKNIVNKLIEYGFTVNIIRGWGEERDKKLAQCKIILNIHGQLPSQESNIFEHIRCDRLLHANYKILSEESLYLPDEFVDLFKDNLKIIPYYKFFYINVDKINSLWPNTFNTLDIDDINNRNKKNKIKSQKKIVDCFIFYNELDILNYRLNILNNIVDYFIIVESTLTHIGNNKKLYFEENKKLFEKFKHKIIHIIVDDFPFCNKNIDITKNQQWVNEQFQRACIKRGIEKLTNNLNNCDLIIISDVDEIPDPRTLSNIKYSNKYIEINHLEQDFYYYNLNSIRNEKWIHPKILSYLKYRELNCDTNMIRFYKCLPIKNGGWHLSYFGTSDFIKNKLLNFAHQEYNKNEITNINNIQNKINNCVDLFDRETNMKYIEIKDNVYLPPYYDIYLSNHFKNSNFDINENIIDNTNNKDINKNKKKYCFIHSSTFIENSNERLDYLIDKLKSSNCINIFDKIIINNIGEKIYKKFGNNIEVINFSDNVKLFETCTINKLLQFAQNEKDSYILYIHTKGIGYDKTHLQYEYVNDWIDMMLYFLVEQHKLCIELLDNNYDTVGCNIRGSKTIQYDSVPLHYSGNFWWANSNYISTLSFAEALPDIVQWSKNVGEFWLFKNNPNYYIIHDSNENHYYSRYPRSKYANVLVPFNIKNT
jgi:beta-1,4-mannosyl-glycoprotein beta-1,4-N-acetylglucosaminyltransferase